MVFRDCFFDLWSHRNDKKACHHEERPSGRDVVISGSRVKAYSVAPEKLMIRIIQGLLPPPSASSQ
jgi:hypothetical protein